jgi:uncharacterized RDD family membrane protein YckC
MNSPPAQASETLPAEPLPTPALWRRMACFVYEGVLLFGVAMATGLLYAGITGQRNAMLGRHGLQVALFVVLGLYFSWFWSHGGQTVAMKAWRIRLVRADGSPVSMGRAMARYLMGWLWFAPALLSLQLTQAGGGGTIFAVLCVGVIAYAALTLLHPDRQFWHDAVCATRLVDWRSVQPRHNSVP